MVWTHYLQNLLSKFRSKTLSLIGYDTLGGSVSENDFLDKEIRFVFSHSCGKRQSFSPVFYGMDCNFYIFIPVLTPEGDLPLRCPHF